MVYKAVIIAWVSRPGLDVLVIASSVTLDITIKDAHWAKLGAHEFGKTWKIQVSQGGLGALPQNNFENDTPNGAF